MNSPLANPSAFGTMYAASPHNCQAAIIPPRASANEVIRFVAEHGTVRVLRNGQKRAVIRIASNHSNSFMLLSNHDIRRMFGRGAGAVQ